jgi:superfamily I DNA and/or RNA helicase
LNTNKEKYLDLIKAVEAERNSEQLFFENLSTNKTKFQKKEAGILLSPVVINRSYYTVGENVEIEIEKPNHQNTSFFRVGKGCKVNSLKTEESYNGTISYDNKSYLRIIIKQDLLEKSQFIYDKSIEIELTYDDRPYAVMIKTLQELLKTDNPLYTKWRSLIGHNRTLKVSHSQPSTNLNSIFPNLNTEQNFAISGSIEAASIAVIHGPPGTGKTTTIVHLIKHIHAQKSKTLVCAPSNNAVDLLVSKLNEMGLKVLRVGNLTRMDDRITHLSIEERMRNHSEWKRIKKIRIEAAEIRKEARAYKRNFGHEEKIKRKILLQESYQLKKWAKELEERLEDEIIADTEVICTTLMGASLPIMKNLKFDQLIIDEASQALEPECWIAMLKSNKVILVGDHKQLPPTVRSKVGQDLKLNTTILDQISHTIPHSFLLKCQYRMNDTILAFPNIQFYNGQLYGASEVRNLTLKDEKEIVTFIDTAGCDFEEVQGSESRSLHNPGEFFILREHLLTMKERAIGHTIGIISPYADQIKYIRQQWSDDTDLLGLEVDINTIDGFQGQEKEIIYISLVRSNSNGQIGFLEDIRRLNVALTRAQKKLVIIGDSATLGSNSTYNLLIEHCEKNATYKSAWEYMSFS